MLSFLSHYESHLSGCLPVSSVFARPCCFSNCAATCHWATKPGASWWIASFWETSTWFVSGWYQLIYQHQGSIRSNILVLFDWWINIPPFHGCSRGLRIPSMSKSGSLRRGETDGCRSHLLIQNELNYRWVTTWVNSMFCRSHLYTQYSKSQVSNLLHKT